jgi:hypothetical protein
MGRFAQTRWARMSSGRYCLIRDLGPVKGGKGLRHHEVVVTLSWRGVIRFLVSVVRETWSRYMGRAPARDAAAVKSPAEISAQATIEP